MSDDNTRLAIAAILETVMAMQAHQAQVFERLDRMDANLVAAKDLAPMLDIILGRLIEDRERQAEGFERTAELAAFAHAAASGNSAPLPDEVADQPLLKWFAFLQPPVRGAKDVALARWEGKVTRAETKELLQVLKAQYTPSPTEFVDVRVLRFRMAAITRAELQERGAALPPARPPAVIRDDSAVSKGARHVELAALWSQGDSLALYGEAELAGAVDHFNRVRLRLTSEGKSPELVMHLMSQLHEKIGEELLKGNVVGRQTGQIPERFGRERGNDAGMNR